MSQAFKFILTVSQLNEYVRSMLSSDPLLKGFRLKGEISNYKRHASGHIYFSLKDENALVRCVMFKSNAQMLRFEPKEGMQVEASGYVSLYTKDGQFQFYCTDIKAQGVGNLHQIFEQNKQRFLEEGLFEKSHKRKLPSYPRCIGVVTSSTGSVILDIIRVAKRRNPNVDILLCPAKVQGEGAAAQIAQSIKRLEQKDVDLIICGRGGGSFEDLFEFNHESVVRAIYDCKVPVISAVGHETDFTLADFVADVRASTPSQASELAVKDIVETMQYLDVCLGRMKSSALYSIQKKSAQLSVAKEKLNVNKILDKLSQREMAIGAILKQMQNQVCQKLLVSQLRIDNLNQKLLTLNPEAVLRRGYGIVKRQNDLITKTDQLKIGDEVQVQLSKGIFEAVVKKIEDIK